jgi:multiple sugar transport system permease protein
VTEAAIARPAAHLNRGVRRGVVRRRIRWGCLYVILTSLALIWLLPVLSTLYTALRSFDDIQNNGPWSFPPHTLSLANFVTAWQSGMSGWFLNSVIVVIPAIIVMLLLSSMTAFVLSRYRFRGSRALFMLFVCGTLLPFQVLLEPVFKEDNFMGIYDSLWALFTIYVAFELGFCTFVLHNFMRTIPKELFDAAVVDGASRFRI